MADQPPLNADSSAVQAHLNMMQGVISRMAENSRYCKMWCVTLVAAVLVLVARTGEPQHALIALAPTLLFWGLDAYYLALERGFRKSYCQFVVMLHNGELAPTKIYRVASTGMGKALVWGSLRSTAIWPFYAALTATTLLAWWLIIPSNTILSRGGW